MVSIKVLKFLIWMCLEFGSIVDAVLTDEYNRIIIFKEPASNKALNGHVIRTEKVTNEGSCRLECYLEPNCVSVNVGTYEERHCICELNSATDESPALANLSNRRNYTYHGIENPCSSNPCREKFSVCQAGFTDRGFRCIDCQRALGMQSGRISDGQISASTQYDENHAANQGRLHFQATGTLHGSWSAEKNDAHPWLQVYLGWDSILVTGVATQGMNGLCCQWVTKYNLQYSDDNVNFRYYREPGESIKNIDGNSDADSVVYHQLNPTIKARYIRFRPVTWNNHISMRVEVYGCCGACPSFWTAYADSLYAVLPTPMSWKQAETFCNFMNARLVKIDSKDEKSFIKTIAPDSNFEWGYWIGLTDADMENHWKWSDGSPLGAYTNWAAHEPNNLQVEEDCVTLFYDVWFDVPCDYKTKFICEKEKLD